MVMNPAFSSPDPDRLAADGFITFDFLEPDELVFIRSAIANRLRELNDLPQLGCRLSESQWHSSLIDYSGDIRFDHRKISEKRSRMLSGGALFGFLAFDSLGKLSRLISQFEISGEESNGNPEVYWRLVRPNQSRDVGPLHADGWFWQCNNSWHRPAWAHRRWKVWVAIENELGRGGLRVVPGTHLRTDIRYDIRDEGGKKKPTLFDPSGSVSASSVLLDVAAGQAVLFDDSLVHGGAITQGRLPRVSLEFTCLVASEVYGK